MWLVCGVVWWGGVGWGVACLASVDGIFDIPHTILFAILLGGEILLLRIFQAGHHLVNGCDDCVEMASQQKQIGHMGLHF